MSERVVVAGASGLTGRAVIACCAQLGWDVIGLSRRKIQAGSLAEHIAVDLVDTQSCKELASLRDVTAVVYCALFEREDLISGWFDPEHTAINVSMLQNLLDALEPANPGLRQITLLQGAKAYGSHLGPINPPAKERAPRHIHPNFYWAQEDLIRQRSEGKPWHWTIFSRLLKFVACSGLS